MRKRLSLRREQQKEHSAQRPGERELTDACAVITKVCLERLCLLTVLVGIDLLAVSLTHLQLFFLSFFALEQRENISVSTLDCSLISHTHTISPVSARC